MALVSAARFTDSFQAKCASSSAGGNFSKHICLSPKEHFTGLRANEHAHIPPVPRNALSRPSDVPLPPSLTAATCVAVVGVGYVGTSLLNELTKFFVNVIGYDVCPSRLTFLRKTLVAKEPTKYQGLKLTEHKDQLRCASYFFIAVPTLLREDPAKSPCTTSTQLEQRLPTSLVDCSFVSNAVSTVLQCCRPGSVVIIESSVSVGMTRALLGPHAHHVHGGMSPERVDPGRSSPEPMSIPKLVSGLTPVATNAIAEIYRRCYANVLPVSAPEVAEMTKLYENCFRMVNIAYANEVADACEMLRIDFKEVLDAATTKPYGFMPFASGPGVGGHCVPVNPYFLWESCRQGAFPVLKRATKTMEQRPRRLASAFHRRIVLDMSQRRRYRSKKADEGTLPRVLVVGIGFKPGGELLSHSPSVTFAWTLRDLGCRRLAFYDPLVNRSTLKEDGRWLEKLGTASWNTVDLANGFDAIAVCVRQHGIEWCVIEELEKNHRCLVRWYV